MIIKTLSITCPTVTTPPSTGSVSITSTPSGATIIIDGVAQSSSLTPATISGLSPGSHTLLLKLSGYQDVNQTFNIVANQTTTVNVTLPVVTTGTLALTSTPSGAFIIIDGVSQGTQKTPATISGLSPGSHTLSLMLGGYQDATHTFNITVNQTTTVNVTLVPTGTLVVTSTPPGATIIIDGVSQATLTPVTILNLPQGSHTLLLKLAGYQDATQPFNIVAGQTTTVNVPLTPVVTTGNLIVASTPSGATIIIDSVSQTPLTPATISGISPGSHTLLLKLSGYQDATQPFNIVVGQNTTVNVTLVSVVATTGSLVISSVPAGAQVTIDGVSPMIALDIGQPQVQSGTVYWYQFSFPSKGTAHTQLIWWFVINIPTVVTLNKLVNNVWVAMPSTDYLDTVNTSDIYGMWISNVPTGLLIPYQGQSAVLTPATILNLTPGSHTLLLTLLGYQNISRTFNVIIGQTTTVNVTLSPVVTTGSLAISSTPPGATIILDSVAQIPLTPTTISNLSAGSHTVLLRLLGYQDSTLVTFNIIAGQTTTVSTILTTPANITAVQPSTATAPVSATGEIDINFTWQNTGGTTGSFTPKVSLNGGAAIDLGAGTITLTPGQTYNITKALTGSGITPGTTYMVCPVPN